MEEAHSTGDPADIRMQNVYGRNPMSCKDCEDSQENLTVCYPYRIGNAEIGWGNLLIIGCAKHVELARQVLNGGVGVPK